MMMSILPLCSTGNTTRLRFQLLIEIIFIKLYEVLPPPLIGSSELSGNGMEVLEVFPVHII